MTLYVKSTKINQKLKISESKIRIARTNNEDAIILDL